MSTHITPAHSNIATLLQFRAAIQDLVKKGFDRDSQGHDSLLKALIWTAAYKLADEALDTDRRELATQFISGFGPLASTEQALGVWDDSWNYIAHFREMGDNEEAEAQLLSSLEGIARFWGLDDQS